MASAVNRQSEAIYDLGLAIYNTNITKDNLKSAPDTLNNVKSNYLWLYMIQQDLKPVIEIYSADDYTLSSAYERFCKYGIRLDKFIRGNDLNKYLNFVSVFPHDKLNYKYVEGDFDINGSLTWYLEQQKKLNKYLSNGVRLIDINSELDENPDNEYLVLLNVKEEEFRFE